MAEASEFDPATSKASAIYMALPDLSGLHLPSRAMITFNALAGNRAPEILSELADKKSFSASLGWKDDAPKDELYIKAPGTGFYIPPVYAQFLPALRQIKDDYYSKYGDDGYCSLGVLQAVIQPDPHTSAPFINGHKDVGLGWLQRDGQAPSHYVYVLSDCLQTGVTDYLYSAADIEEIRTAPDPEKAQNEIHGRDHVVFRSAAPAYCAVAMDSTTSHALANPPIPTRRTALVVAFTGPELPPPSDFLNPWLKEAIIDQKRTSQSGSGIYGQAYMPEIPIINPVQKMSALPTATSRLKDTGDVSNPVIRR